jgi:hypothetical protein
MEHEHEPTGPIQGRWESKGVPERVYDGKTYPAYTVTTVHVERACRPYVAAPGQQPRCEENRGGDFYTDCETCLFCDVPHVEAPDLMAYVQHPDGRWHCVFTRQPGTPDEIERAIDAMCGSEVCGIRYGGSDPDILRRVAARTFPAGDGTTDVPLPKSPDG